MVSGTFFDHTQYFVASLYITKEYIGNQKGNDEEYEPFQSFFSDFFCIPFLSVQSHLCSSVAFYPIFYPSENHFHKYSLRTYPPTKYTTESYCKQGNKYNTDNHRNYYQVKILRPERETEYTEFSFYHVEQ